MKINRSHPIPEDQQIIWTPSIEQLAVHLYLKGVALNRITKILEGQLKKELREKGELRQLKSIEGRAVEERVHRLFVGGAFAGSKHKWYKQLPQFDSLPNRTGCVLGKRETNCIKLAIKHKRDIDIFVCLTGRDEKEMQEILRSKKSLFD